MLGMNGTSAGDFNRKPRYFIQWVTQHDPSKGGCAQIRVVGWCIRDQHTSLWDRVFEHKDEEVCRKMLKILNEG